MFFPETKGMFFYARLGASQLTLLIPSGKSLEEMAEIFGDQVDALDVLGKYESTKSPTSHKHEIQESHLEKSGYA